MENHCHDSSCQSHSHESAKSSGCGCGCPSCSCARHESSCHEESECCDYAAHFLALADDAWMEVLKDKIKAYILTNDKKIDGLAKIIAEANKEKWHNKKQQHQADIDFEKQLESSM
jgi:hypothetical protein